MSIFVDASTVSPDTVHKSLVIENEKLKKVLEIARKSLLVSCHILNEEEADFAMEKSQKALKEINEVLR